MALSRRWRPYEDADKKRISYCQRMDRQCYGEPLAMVCEVTVASPYTATYVMRHGYCERHAQERQREMRGG